MAATATTHKPGGDVGYLCRALKAPSMAAAVERLAERARADGWTHEEFLAACLEREVAARAANGGELRIRAARFPARKSLDEFDFDHQRSLRRDVVAHLGAAPVSRGPHARADPVSFCVCVCVCSETWVWWLLSDRQPDCGPRLGMASSRRRLAGDPSDVVTGGVDHVGDWALGEALGGQCARCGEDSVASDIRHDGKW
jgi:IstB-like ATP binding protein